MQEEQNANIHDLSNILGPLSPSGQIPGVDEDGNLTQSYFPDTLDDNLDINEFLDSNALNYDHGDPKGGSLGPTDGNDFNFSLDGGYGAQEAALAELRGCCADTPSPAGTEEIPRDDLNDSPARDNKRRRVG